MTNAKLILGEFPPGNYLYSFTVMPERLRESHVLQHDGGLLAFEFHTPVVTIYDPVLEALFPITMEKAHSVMRNNDDDSYPAVAGGSVTFAGEV